MPVEDEPSMETAPQLADLADNINLLTTQAMKANKAMLRYGVKESFIDTMEKEASDWAFAIKVAALIEAVLTKYTRFVIEPHLDYSAKFNSYDDGIEIITANSKGKTRTRRVNARSSLGDKIDLLEGLKAMEPHNIAWLRAIKELRNLYAHEVKFIEASFGDILRTLKRAHALNIADAIFYSMYDKEQRLAEITTESASEPPKIFPINDLARSGNLPRVLNDFYFTNLSRMKAGIKEPYYTTNIIDKHQITLPLRLLISGIQDAEAGE